MKRRQLFACFASAVLLGVSESLGLKPVPPTTPRRSIDEYLLMEADMIGADIYHRVLSPSPWLALVPTVAWHDGRGETVTP